MNAQAIPKDQAYTNLYVKERLVVQGTIVDPTYIKVLPTIIQELKDQQDEINQLTVTVNELVQIIKDLTTIDVYADNP